MSVISTQLEIIDNMSVPLINIASNIENVIDLMSVADGCIDVWGNNTPDWLSSVSYVSSAVDEISSSIERNIVLVRDFNNAVVVGVKEMDKLVDKANAVRDVEIKVNVSENIDVNGVIEKIDVTDIVKGIDVSGIVVNVDVNATVENIDDVSNKLMNLRDIQNDISNISINTGAGIGQNAFDDIMVGVDVAYEMTFGNLFTQIEMIKESFWVAVDTVDYGVDAMRGILMGIGGMLVENVASPFYAVFGEVSEVVSNCMIAPVETVRNAFGGLVQDIISQFVNMSSVIENIINKIPMVNVDITTGVNNIYNNVVDTYSSKNNSKVADRVARSEAPEVNVYRNDINTVKDSIEFGKSVAVSEADRKYMQNSVSVDSNKFAVADVNVTVNNNNNISSEVDANVVVAKLSDGIKQAMNVAVSGVYA